MRALLLSLFIGSSLVAQNPVKLASKIKQVQIFQPGATLYREAAVKLNAGQHELEFEGLSIGLDPNTIQLFSDGDLEVISFQLKNVGFEERDKPKAYLALQEKVKTKSEELALIEAELESLRIEKSLLEENKKIGGNQGYSMEQLKAITSYTKAQTLTNAKAVYALNQQKQSLKEELKALNNDLTRLRQKFNQLQSIINVKVRNDRPVNTKIGLSYSYRNNINWDPVYRLEFVGLDQDLELEQLAQVYQNTGEDLVNVKVTLSTGSPSSNNQLPRLQTNFINLYTPYTNNGSGSNEPVMLKEVVMADAISASKRKLTSKRIESNPKMETRQDFKLQGTYRIPNAKQELLALQSISLKADFHYESVPKIDPSVYLMAKLKDYQKHQLIAGKVSIFNEGAYNGSLFTDFKSVNEDLCLSLGKDRSFNITYERVFNEERKSLFGGTKVELFHYRIKMKPTKVNGNHLIIKDQIPISQNNDLKVKLIESPGAEFDEETGFLTWKMEILNSGAQQIDYKYELKYPSNQEVR